MTLQNIETLDMAIYNSILITNKIKKCKNYSQNIYAALCNNEFKNKSEVVWSCSWRSAGRLVAGIREEGDYLDWYCSGIAYEVLPENFVLEQTITKEIQKDFENIGWTCCTADLNIKHTLLNETFSSCHNSNVQ
jgi:hypothetical protein